MIVHEMSTIGESVLRNQQAVLIGLSIRNNYFKEDTIEELTRWASNNFGSLVFMLPDVPAMDTLCGLGYPFTKAREKAMLACNNLENKCQRIINKLDIAEKANIVRWAHLEGNSVYRKSFSRLSELYKNDDLFRKDARNATRHVMLSQETVLPIEESIDVGVGFLLKELSFIAAASEVLELACATAYLYHRPMPVLHKLLSGQYAYSPSSMNGYIICEVESRQASLEQAIVEQAPLVPSKALKTSRV